MYYLCSANKGVDQLCGYRTADLRLCFRICKKPGFSQRGSFKTRLTQRLNSITGDYRSINYFGYPWPTGRLLTINLLWYFQINGLVSLGITSHFSPLDRKISDWFILTQMTGQPWGMSLTADQTLRVRKLDIAYLFDLSPAVAKCFASQQLKLNAKSFQTVINQIDNLLSSKYGEHNRYKYNIQTIYYNKQNEKIMRKHRYTYCKKHICKVQYQRYLHFIMSKHSGCRPACAHAHLISTPIFAYLIMLTFN